MKKSELSIGMGHGLEGRYGGLPDLYSSLANSEIVLLSVPFDRTTTYQQGTDKGPEAIIEASRNMELYDIETNSEVYRKGIFTAPFIRKESSEEMLNATYLETKKYLTLGKCPIVLGGEHSISFAPIKAYAEFYKKLTILQFDAHADLYPAYEGNPLSHASVMARVKELKGISKIVSIGIRSLGADELPFLDRPHTFFAHEIYENTKWIDEVLGKLSDPVYITFDLDVFDSSLMPSTGTPEPGGLDWNQTLKILKRIALEKTIVGFDVVELSPKEYNPAPDYLAAKLIYKLLSYKYHLK